MLLLVSDLKAKLVWAGMALFSNHTRRGTSTSTLILKSVFSEHQISESGNKLCPLDLIIDDENKSWIAFRDVGDGVWIAAT